MTYIDYMNQFWRASSLEHMPTSEVALYAFIVNECNQHRWNMPVPCSTVRICEVLHMSKQTLCTARKNLAKRGLISFTDGKSRHVPSKYSLLKWTENLTVELTDGLTPITKDIEKDNFKTNRCYDTKSSKNQRRVVKEIPTTAASYEAAF